MTQTHPHHRKSSDTISRMLKSHELKHPEVYFLISHDWKEYGTHLQDIRKEYRLKYLSVGNLLDENAKKHLVENEEQLGKATLIAELIQTKIKKLGNRVYLIEGVLTSGRQYEELLTHLSKNIEFKGFVYLCDPNAAQLKDEKHEELAGLLSLLEGKSLLRKIPQTANPKDIQEHFLALLKKDGLEVPPLIPVICILGGPGSGKGTNCEKLALDYGFRHISTGDLLRSYKEGQWFETINSLMKDGKLVPSDMLLEIVKEEMDRYNYEGVYLLDGFPRNQQNMLVWNQVMNGFASIVLYLYLECDEKIMEKRLISRSEVSGRLDDTPEIIMKRFKTFEKMTVPFIKETLAVSQEKVITVDATSPLEEVYKNIQEGLAQFGIKPIIKADKPSVLFILGGPGAGKGTQCEVLVKEYGYKHLSTGDLLRDEIKNKGPESASIEQFIKEGKLVPSTTLVKLMKNRIMNEGWSGHYLIDGFPRGIENIKAWYDIMADTVHIDSLFYFDCSIEVMEKRLLNRSLTSGRSDDNPITIKKRFITFKSETEPFLEFYRNSGGKILRINADQPVEAVTEDIRKELRKLQLIKIQAK